MATASAALLTSRSREDDMRGHRTNTDDTGRQVNRNLVRSASNLTIVRQ